MRNRGLRRPGAGGVKPAGIMAISLKERCKPLAGRMHHDHRPTRVLFRLDGGYQHRAAGAGVAVHLARLRSHELRGASLAQNRQIAMNYRDFAPDPSGGISVSSRWHFALGNSFGYSLRAKNQRYFTKMPLASTPFMGLSPELPWITMPVRRFFRCRWKRWTRSVCTGWRSMSCSSACSTSCRGWR